MTGHYVLSTPDGDLYACSDVCATSVFGLLAGSEKISMIAMEWSCTDRDVFCASCGVPLGWRRRSARLLHDLMTRKSRHLYDRIHERWWHGAETSK